MGKTRVLPRARARRGQTIVIVALSALVLIGLVALAVDGGNALVQRRNMQNAADAAAQAAAQLLQTNMTTTCGPTGCHPTYLLTNQDMINRVQELVNANGAQTYALEYHYNTCSLGGSCYAAPGPGGDPLPQGYPWIDGVRVTSGISATTTFAQAINIPYIPVQAVAAARLYPTCVPTDLTGAVLPLTRFRPAVETELTGSQGARNDLCHPLKLWDWNAATATTDIQVGNFSNILSFNATPFHAPDQPLLAFTHPDTRSGLFGNYQNKNATLRGAPPEDPCPGSCADMDGSATSTGDMQDITNWIYWNWGLSPSDGVLSSTRQLLDGRTGTFTPANRQTDCAKVPMPTNPPSGCDTRQGDWTDVYQTSDLDLTASGSTNFDSIPYAIADDAHYHGRVSVPSGWNFGNGIDHVVYLWGSALTDFNAAGGDNQSSQIWLSIPDPPGCGPIPPQPVCNGYTGWEDLSITGSYPAYSASDSQINRVRFTRAVRVRLYENMARHDGINTLGSACFGFPNFNDPGYANTVWGYVMNVPLPGPTDAALCPAPGTWVPGGGVYVRLIDPSAP